MPTIFTKFLCRTDQLPARVKAWTQTRGEAAYWPYTESMSKIGNHAAACERLARKLHWNDRHFVGGPLGCGFAFIPCDVTEAHTHALTGHHHGGERHADAPKEEIPEFDPRYKADMRSPPRSLPLLSPKR